MTKLPLDDQELHRYLRVYHYYRELILSGKLKPGTKLPSIRKCAAQLAISRTTVENAYMMLAAEGYILSKPQSGFYVTELLGGSREQYQAGAKKEERQKVQYDFAASNVDRASFQFDLWRRYIKSALRQDERLLSYGEPQGEPELREALCGYLARHRNVVCTPDHIVIGAGVQSLLHVLCPMIRDRKTAILYHPEFRQGRTIFEDYGFELHGYGEGQYGEGSCNGQPYTQGRETESVQAESGTSAWDLCRHSLFYITPSQMTVWGEVMHIADRMALIKEAFERDALIIEDDYNSEFRYYNKPTPSLQGLAGGRNVVYLGTFSRLLLPSIRLSYMVLPPELLEIYRKRGGAYNQTASKAEQIALCQFIRDGHLESQIRKARKLYTSKAKKLCEEIGRVFGERAKAHLGEAGFLVLVKLRTNLTSEEIAARARQAGVAVRPVGKENSVKKESPVREECPVTDGRRSEFPEILLSCSTVAPECYEEALLKLKEAVFGPF